MSREEDRETLEKFFNCVREQNYQDIEEAYKAVCQMPECNSYNDQDYTYGKAYYIDERIYPTEDNIDFHPYIKGYYDMAVTEQMRWGKETSADLRRIRKSNDSATFDGTRELVFFLNNYRYLKDTLEKQGKEIFRPDSFDKYPFLEDYAKGIFRNEDGKVIQDASQCKTISELVKNKDAVNNYCNSGIFVYNSTEYWYNIERKYNEWGKKKWREIYTQAENETFKQGNIATLSDEEKEFILGNTESTERAVEVGKTVDDAFLRDLKIADNIKAEIIYAKAKKPEKLSDADKEFILKHSFSEETLGAVAKVYDFKAQSSEKLHELLSATQYKRIGKDIAKEYIDACRGDVAYGRLISHVLTKEEFDKAVEDYKITSYKRDNERLTAENQQLREEHKKVEQKEVKLNDEQQQFQRYVDHKSAEIKAKSAEIAFKKDIDDLYKEGPNKFEPARQKELFAKMKEELAKNPNLREGHLAAMCKIYTSKTNTPEEKAEYFKDLHEIRKSGKTNAEKREMARTFGRVLERNPELAKDEALKGLAKVDYSAVGYTPTKRGFTKNAKEGLEK